MVWSSLSRVFALMLSWMNGLFSNLKVPDKSADMKMMSEGLEYGRFLDKWMKYLCLRFRLFSFLLPEGLRIVSWMVGQF